MIAITKLNSYRTIYGHLQHIKRNCQEPHELTSLYILYWSMAQTVGTWVVKSCESDTCLLQALAHISLVFPTAVSPTTTHLTSSWCGCSLSITDNHPFSSNTPTHVPGRLNTRLPPLLPFRWSNGAMSTSDLHRIKDDAARRSSRSLSRANNPEICTYIVNADGFARDIFRKIANN